jgi:hypothetical protein
MILFALLAGAFGGCGSTTLEETALFEEAEARFSRGDYDGATLLYREFLRLHELSPLADIAEQRLRAVEREVDAVMGRRGAPAPVYVNPARTSLPTRVDDDGFVPVSAPTIPTLGQ